MEHSIVLILFMFISIIEGKKFKEEEKPKWAKKDILDFDDADLERLYDQWEEDDEDPLEPDEMPEHLRPSPKLDLSKMDMSDPESILKLSKKGKTLMAFVTVDGNPTRDETEKLTGIWQMGLMNSHISAERFTISDDRAIFMFKDGSRAWEAKDYLVQQERMKEVTIENKPYPGVYHSKDESSESKDEL